MKRILLTIILLAVIVFGASAQRYGSNKNKKYYTNTVSFGIGCGSRCDFMEITNVAPELSGDPFPKWRVYASAFASWEFWEDRIGIRPQLTFLKRGAEYNCYGDGLGANVGYFFNAFYIDVRMPIVFNFVSSNSRSSVVPYMFATPILGIAVGGNIMLDGSEISVATKNIYMKVPVSDANTAKHYFGVGAGLGVKFKALLGRTNCFFGFEVMYDHGITDTYSKTEKDGKSNDVGQLVDYTHYKLKGERKHRGIEMQVTYSVPTTLYFHRREKPQTTRSVRNL